MRSILLLICLLATGALATEVVGQDSGLRANELRVQLLELQGKQERLEGRLKELAEELKPENIEHSLAGVGSTRPEDLRESRRRQLETEKTATQTQLNILSESRTRLEAAIARADADAYHESAKGIPVKVSPASVQTPPPVTNEAAAQPKSAKPKVKRRHTRRRARN